jgi:pimeloyl-ACP methyl ester carboxylesterase
MITNFLELSDGRRLCYAEYGDSNGTPIFVFYGNPGSRLFWGVIPGSPILPNVRLIAPDRPGYGQTDFVGCLHHVITFSRNRRKESPHSQPLHR